MTPVNLSVPPKPPAPAHPPDYVVKEVTYPQWAQAFAQFMHHHPPVELRKALVDVEGGDVKRGCGHVVTLRSGTIAPQPDYQGWGLIAA